MKSQQFDPVQIAHTAEQLETALSQFAGVLSSFQRDLTRKGFTREEAQELTTILFVHMLHVGSAAVADE